MTPCPAHSTRRPRPEERIDEGIGGRPCQQHVHVAEREDGARTRARFRSLPGGRDRRSDPELAGRDAGELLDGRPAGIPIVATLDEAMAIEHSPPKWCVIGIATHGGRLIPEIHTLILEAVGKGLGIVNGLHDAASDDAEIAAAARMRGVDLVDLRKSKPKHELHFWQGDIYHVRAPRLAVLGTDCAVGKRTTARMLVEAMNRAGCAPR